MIDYTRNDVERTFSLAMHLAPTVNARKGFAYIAEQEFRSENEKIEALLAALHDGIRLDHWPANVEV